MDRPESLLAAKGVSKALGLPFVLSDYATIEQAVIEDESVTVLMNVFEVKETVREVRFIRSGKRLMKWVLDWTGEYESGWKYESITMWDDSFSPYAEHKVGKIESPAEYRARRIWEGNVYRPGSDKSPMDSASRVTEGYSPMERYWNN